MKTSRSKLAGAIASIFVIFVCCCIAEAQAESSGRVVNLIPTKIPVKVEILRGGPNSPLDEIEFRITNAGKKPILYLGLKLATEKEFVPGHTVGLRGFDIGNVRVSNFSRSLESLADELSETIPFEPGETHVFRISKSDAELLLKAMKERGYSDDARLALSMWRLRFADGTGYDTPQAVEMPRPNGSKE